MGLKDEVPAAGSCRKVCCMSVPSFVAVSNSAVPAIAVTLPLYAEGWQFPLLAQRHARDMMRRPPLPPVLRGDFRPRSSDPRLRAGGYHTNCLARRVVAAELGIP